MWGTFENSTELFSESHSIISVGIIFDYIMFVYNLADPFKKYYKLSFPIHGWNYDEILASHFNCLPLNLTKFQLWQSKKIIFIISWKGLQYSVDTTLKSWRGHRTPRTCGKTGQRRQGTLQSHLDECAWRQVHADGGHDLLVGFI